MKKLLLILAVALASTATHAQLSCAIPTTINGNGTFTTPAITGVNQAICLASKANIKAVWYKYTPAANGELKISSNLPINDGVTYNNDTRLSVLTGTCAALSCVDSNDDVSETNYLSEITVPVVAGTVYYIQWDNYWNVGTPIATLGHQFTVTFNAVPCIRIGSNDFYLPEDYSTTSATLYWDQAVGSPANYDIDWSTDFDAAPGTGTIVTSPAGALAYSTATLSGLPASSNFRYYIRANCGATQSAWQGPNFGYLASPATAYTNTFEDEAKNFTDGLVGTFALFNSAADSTPANYADGGIGHAVYTFNSTTAVSDRRAYTRGFNLAAGETVTFSFKSRLWVPSGIVSPMILALTVGTGQSAADQATVVQSYNLTSALAYTTHTATYTATAAGTYFFGFHNKSAIGANQTYAFIDSIGTTSVLGVNDFATTEFTVVPNPASDLIQISNNKNVLVQNITVTDLNGRTVKQFNYNNVSEVSVNVSDLSSGMYMMSINTDQGSITKKIIKK